MSSPSLRHDYDHESMLELAPAQALFPDNDDEVIPASDNSMLNIVNVNFPNFRPHSRTISLDDHINQRYLHQHSTSMASLNQDPPFAGAHTQVPQPIPTQPPQLRGLHYVPQLLLPQSHSQNTLASSDSVPQLSNSLSNHSLLDSPSSAVKNTPSRHKSLSVSAGSASAIYQTPLRGQGGSSLSPANLTAAANSKIKKKGHSRSRSRLSFDANNPHGINLLKQPLNPFVAPNSQEELDTPLTTPQQMPPGSERQFLSPGLNMKSAGSSVRTNVFSTPFPLHRNDTLESIKIDEQDDDAFKQVQKARSYVNLASIGKPDLSLLLQDSGSRLNFESEGIASSNSTPGGLYSHYSPSGIPSAAGPSSYSVPATAGASVMDFSAQFNQDLLSEMLYPPDMNEQHQMENLDYDLLQHQFVPKTDSFMRSFPASNDLAGIFGGHHGGQTISQTTHGSQQLQHTDHGYPMDHSMEKNLALNLLVPMPQSQQQSPLYHDHRGNSLLPPMATFTKDEKPASSPGEKKNSNDKKNNNDKKKREKTHECHLCHLKFHRPEHVKRHLKSHSSEKPFQCDEVNCGKRFNRKDNLRAHLKKVHHIFEFKSHQ